MRGAPALTQRRGGYVGGTGTPASGLWGTLADLPFILSPVLGLAGSMPVSAGGLLAGRSRASTAPPPHFMASFFHLQNADSHCLQHPVGASLPHPRPPRKRLRNSPSSYTVSNITFPSAERKGRMFWGAEELFGVEL